MGGILAQAFIPDIDGHIAQAIEVAVLVRLESLKGQYGIVPAGEPQGDLGGVFAQLHRPGGPVRAVALLQLCGIAVSHCGVVVHVESVAFRIPFRSVQIDQMEHRGIGAPFSGQGHGDGIVEGPSPSI